MAGKVKQELTRPTEWETWRYIRNFLLVLMVTFGGISVVLLAYDLYTSGRAAEAATLLEGEPSADSMKQAFEQLESPHLFSGWRVPDSILPPDDKVLAGLDEEKLAAAATALDKKVVGTATSTPPGRCAGVLPCVIEGLGRPPAVNPKTKTKQLPQSYKVYRYLMLRRSMARGEELTAAELKFFRWNRTLWVRAFRRQIMDGKGTPTASDRILLSDLQVSLAGSSDNGLIFSYYGLAAAFVFGLTLLGWMRMRRPTEPEVLATSETDD